MKYLFFLIFLFSINSFAISCIDDDIDLNPGDVISADMIKDIFERISGITQGMKANQLDGTWVCTANTALWRASSNPLANNFIANDRLNKSQILQMVKLVTLSNNINDLKDNLKWESSKSHHKNKSI